MADLTVRRWWARLNLAQRAKTHSTERTLDEIAKRVSSRLHVRFVEPQDLAFFLEMANDHDAAEANGWTDDEGPSTQRRFADREGFAAFRATELVGIERATNTRIGTATLTREWAVQPGASTVGVHIHPDFRRRGYGHEMMAIAILLLQQSANELYVVTRVTNHGLQAIMAQLGYDPEPDVRDFVAPNGKNYDSYWYRCGPPAGPPQLPPRS